MKRSQEHPTAAVRPAATEIRSAIDVDFGAGTAGARFSHGPEVVGLVLPEHPVRRQPHVSSPDPERVIVLPEDGDPEPGCIESVHPRHELPGHGNRFGLEVVPEGKIAQHLEERVVPGRPPHLLQIVVLAGDPEALLGRAGAPVAPLLPSQEDLLELVHPGVGEQERGIVGGNQGRARHHLVPPVLEKAEECPADFQPRPGSLVRRHATFLLKNVRQGDRPLPAASPANGGRRKKRPGPRSAEVNSCRTWIAKARTRGRPWAGRRRCGASPPSPRGRRRPSTRSPGASA